MTNSLIFYFRKISDSVICFNITLPSSGIELILNELCRFDLFKKAYFKKIGQQNRDIFQHLKSDILNIYLEYIQLCFPRQSPYLY